MTLGPNSWKPWKWVDLVSKITKFLEKLSQALVAGTPGIPTQFPMCWKRHSRSSHGFDWRDVSIRAGLNGKLCVKHKNVRLKFDLCSLKKVFGFCHNMFPAGRYWWIFILNIHVQYVLYFNWCRIYRFYLPDLGAAFVPRNSWIPPTCRSPGCGAGHLGSTLWGKRRWRFGGVAE